MTDQLPRRAPEGFALPPHNIDAEQAVLGGALINNISYHSASRLRPEHFYEPLHAYTWDAIGRLIGQGHIADFRTVELELLAWAKLQGQQTDWLRGYLGKLVGCAETIIVIADYAEHLIELAGRRRLAEFAQATGARASDLSCVEALSEQLADVRAKVDDMAIEYQSREPWKPLGRVMDRCIKSMSSPAERYSTGLRQLDEAISGGMGAGQVYGFEARMKGFKTGTMGTIALSLMRQQIPFLFVALEMGSERIIERLVAHATGCNAVRFRKRQDPDDLVAKLTAFSNGAGRAPAYFADEPGCSLDRLRSLAAEAVLKLGIQVLLIDYWQLVTGQKRGASTAEHLTAVAQWMAEFAAKHNVTVVVTSQTNRDGYGYGSDGLAKACDWMGRLHKTDGADNRGRPCEAIWIEVLHNRDGDDRDLGSEQSPAFIIDMHGPVLIDRHVEVAHWTGGK